MEGSDDVYVHKFSISMGGKTLFNDCKLALMHGRRYGLIGPNGCGKSTLMTALGYGTNEDIKAGTPPNMDILLVEQEVEASDEITALEMVLSADTKRTALLKEQAELEKQLEEGGVKYIKKAKLTPIDGGEFKKDTRVRFEGRECTVLEEIDEDGDITIQDVFDEDGALAARLRDVYDELADIGADSAETRASTILTGLQFLEEQKSWPTSSFSGGWRMRISLARALFRKPRLLLLDEPTNHLDLHAVIWLEGYLQKWKHTIVVVSHDRDFLTTVCTDILHCWQKKLVHYAGNYEVFEKVHSSRLEEYKKEFERQQKRLKELRKTGKVGKELDKKDIQTVLGRTGKESRKEMKDFGGAGGSDDEDVALLDEIKHLNMRIHFAVGGEIAMPMLAVDKVSFGYPNQPILFKNVDFGLNMDSRVALVGANGTGKSTLLKLMLQELDPTEGEVRQSRMCRIGVYNQHSCDQLAKDVRLAKGEKLTPVTYLMHKFHDYNYQQVRDMLGRFGLEGHHHEQEIATLSGGQKSRVVFVELGMQRSHLLLLDEPTNHLDLETVDCLVTALRNFKGGVMVITHNMSLINAVCREIWVIEGGEVNVFHGEFEEYRDELAEKLAAVVDEDPEEKRLAKEKAEAQAAKAAAAASSGDGAAKEGPKNKAQRDKERAEARKAAQAKAAAAAAEKAAAEEAARAAKAAEEAAAAAARKAAEDARLKFESDLAKAAISGSALPLDEAMAQLVAEAEGEEAVCGGLLVLAQLHKVPSLLGALVRAVVESGKQLGGGGAEAEGEARLLLGWVRPLGWLVRHCSNLRVGQRALLDAVEACADGRPQLLLQAAPLLKGFWEAELLEEAELLAWADDPSAEGELRRFAAPVVEWLRSVPADEPEIP